MDYDKVLRWVAIEQRDEARKKFNDDSEAKRTATMFTDEDLWQQFLHSYYHRAMVLGLDTPLGRQALAKYVSTAVAMLGSVVERYGPLPAPGVPSGEIREWEEVL